MATIRLYLDARYSKDEAPVKLSVTHNGQTALLSLDVKVSPDQWDKKVQAVVNHPNKKEINQYLSAKKSSAERELIRLSSLGELKSMTAVDLRDRLLGKQKAHSFVERYEKSISMKSKAKTIKGYRWTLDTLREYDSAFDSKMFEDITVDYINEFISWCQKEKKLNRNSCNIHLRYIRAVFNDAIKAGMSIPYPFRSISLKAMPVRKKALTLEQLRTLYHYPCEPYQEEYRDMFMLMFFFRGINAVDLFSATLSQVVNGRLEYRRSKVGTLFSIKIEPEAMEIINRYKGKNHLLSPLDRYNDYEDYLHHMNKALKAIGRLRGKRGKVMMEGLFPELSSNWARHSWATAGIELDIPKEVIMRGMGHSQKIVTDIYIDFDFAKVDDANRRIIDAIL